jgi:hypothetical protein
VSPENSRTPEGGHWHSLLHSVVFRPGLGRDGRGTESVQKPCKPSIEASAILSLVTCKEPRCVMIDGVVDPLVL